MNLKIALILSVAALSSGCVQMPTTTSSTVDNRPQVFFTTEKDADIKSLRVRVDGLDNGPLDQFTGNSGALRILPGTHVIEVVDGNTVISSQKIYVSEGVTKEVLIK